MTNLSRITKNKDFYDLFTRSFTEFEKLVHYWETRPFVAVFFVPPRFEKRSIAVPSKQ